jgi:hypothetical protein
MIDTIADIVPADIPLAPGENGAQGVFSRKNAFGPGRSYDTGVRRQLECLCMEIVAA